MALRGARVLLPDGFVDDCVVRIETGRIASVGTIASPGRGESALLMPPGSILAPGFIDVQVNGGGGVLFNDQPNRLGMTRIAHAHRASGTTSLLPTLITSTPQHLAQAIAAFEGDLPSGVLGVHLEGPFISPKKPGIHNPACIRPIDPPTIALLCRAATAHSDRVILLTVAPECVDDTTLRLLARAGIILCAGHTEAAPERLQTACGAGLRGYTHLFNAMPPLQSRAPGPAAMALADARSFCGLIADGIHVHPTMLRLAVAAKPRDRLFLVSDSMSLFGTESDAFALDGRPITRQDGRLTGPDGTLAGADLDLASAVRYMVQQAGVDLAEALRMASSVPAALLRLDHRVGQVAPGLQADLVLLSADLKVLGAWQAGVWQSATSSA